MSPVQLDDLPLNSQARVRTIDWAVIPESEGHRLRSLGLEEGVEVEALHKGILFWRDPIAVRVGRMRIAMLALVGNPNSGKSSLFNALTGARQKIANYPGVTVERKSGRTALPDGRPVELLDLPGAYSVQPDSLDEAVTRDVVLGKFAGQR
eukprot:gene41385-65456_t